MFRHGRPRRRRTLKSRTFPKPRCQPFIQQRIKTAHHLARRNPDRPRIKPRETSKQNLHDAPNFELYLCFSNNPSVRNAQLEHPRKSKVFNLNTSLPIDQNLTRFKRPVIQALSMSIIKSVQNVIGRRLDLFRRKPSPPCSPQTFQRDKARSMPVIRCHKGQLARFEANQIFDRHDVRNLHRREHRRNFIKARRPHNRTRMRPMADMPGLLVDLLEQRPLCRSAMLQLPDNPVAISKKREFGRSSH